MNEEFKPLKSMDNKFGIAKNGNVKKSIGSEYANLC